MQVKFDLLSQSCNHASCKLVVACYEFICVLMHCWLLFSINCYEHFFSYSSVNCNFWVIVVWFVAVAARSEGLGSRTCWIFSVCHPLGFPPDLNSWDRRRLAVTSRCLLSCVRCGMWALSRIGNASRHSIDCILVPLTNSRTSSVI